MVREFFIHEVNSDFEIGAYTYQNYIFIMIAFLSVFLIIYFT